MVEFYLVRINGDQGVPKKMEHQNHPKSQPVMQAKLGIYIDRLCRGITIPLVLHLPKNKGVLWMASVTQTP